MRRRQDARFIGVLLSVACATPRGADSLPPWLLDPKAHPPPQCPADRMIAEVGTSHGSAQQARDAARGQVADAIAASIESNLEDFNRVTLKDGRAVHQTDIARTIRQRSRFDHGELIRLVGSARQHAGTWYALACLDRAETRRILLSDASPAVARFRAAAEQAHRELGAGNRAAFVSQFNVAHEAAAKALPLMAQVRSLSADQPAILSDDLRLRREYVELMNAAFAIRATLSMALSAQVQDLAPDDARHLTTLVGDALARMHVPAQVAGAPGCAAATGRSHALTLSARKSCRWGQLGHNCELSLSLQATECPAGTVLFDSAYEGARSGTDVHDPAAALHRAVAAVQAEDVEHWLRPLLLQQVPGL